MIKIGDKVRHRRKPKDDSVGTVVQMDNLMDSSRCVDWGDGFRDINQEDDLILVVNCNGG